MIRLKPLIMLLMLCPFTGRTDNGKATADTSAQYVRYLPLLYPWLELTNAAGLAVDSVPAVGQTFVDVAREAGSFRRAQQPASANRFRFFSGRYQRLKGVAFYGSFSYTRQQDHNLRMTDVTDPYRGTPYVMADSVGGDWKRHLYQLSFKIAPVGPAAKKVIPGAGLIYKAATGSRKNDPRPLTLTNEVELFPSVIYRPTAGNLIGLTGYAGFFKENVSLSVKNTTVNHRLYRLNGLGQYSIPQLFSVSAGGYYAGKRFGADMQYENNRGGRRWLVQAGYRHYAENADDGTATTRKAGLFERDTYSLHGVMQRTTSSSVKRIWGRVDHDDGTGTEYHQSYDAASATWIIVLKAPFTTAKRTGAALGYQQLKMHNNECRLMWYISADYGLAENRYLLPVSVQRLQTLTGTAGIEKNSSLSSGNRISTGIGAQYVAVPGQKLDYTEMTTTSNLVALRVLYPDHDYLSADAFSLNPFVRYDIKLRTALPAYLFLKGTAAVRFRRGSSSAYYSQGAGRTEAVISAGITY